MRFNYVINAQQMLIEIDGLMCCVILVALTSGLPSTERVQNTRATDRHASATSENHRQFSHHLPGRPVSPAADRLSTSTIVVLSLCEYTAVVCDCAVHVCVCV